MRNPNTMAWVPPFPPLSTRSNNNILSQNSDITISLSPSLPAYLPAYLYRYSRIMYPTKSKIPSLEPSGTSIGNLPTTRIDRTERLRYTRTLFMWHDMTWHGMAWHGTVAPRDRRAQKGKEKMMMNRRRRRKRRRSSRMAADTNVNPRNDFPPESMSYCGVCMCACIYVCTVPARSWIGGEERKKKKTGRLLVPGWRSCPVRGHEGKWGEGWKIGKMGKNKNENKNMK